MSKEERRRNIRSLLGKSEHCTVAELAVHFDTSEVTIRSDLAALESIGAAIRTHGGALVQRDNDDVPISIKQTQHHAEKVKIAQAAAALIQDGEIIVLDSGTTTAEIARQIRGLRLKSLTVITNALNIAVLLANVPHLNLIMPGGVLRPKSYSFSGPQAELALAGLQADRLFLGVDSLDPEIGLMTPHVLEAQLNAQMIRISRQVIAVTDSSKLLQRNLSVIAPVDQLDILITDKNADSKCIDA
ncbi:MAG: DeoR/GlpR family DNA-binding transcription regulator, partial [Lysobacterales bacterium]